MSHISCNNETWYTLPQVDPENIWITWHTSYILLTSVFFLPKTSKCCYIKKYRHRLHIDTQLLIPLTYFEFLKIALIKLVQLLMMSAKMATLGFIKIKVFWKNGYEVIMFVHDVTNKILSRDSNCIVDVVIWPKFGNSSIYIREVIMTSFS